jgi:hypothetical protein
MLAMLANPSNPPWWIWFLCSVGAFIFSALAFILPQNLQPRGWYIALFLVIIFALAGFLFGCLAVVRLVG